MTEPVADMANENHVANPVSDSASSPLTDMRCSQFTTRIADANEGGTALIRPSVLMHRRAFLISANKQRGRFASNARVVGVGDTF